MGERGSSENLFLLDGRKDKENCPPTTLVAERPTQPPRSQRSRPFGKRYEKVTELVYWTLFEKIVCNIAENYFKNFFNNSRFPN